MKNIISALLFLIFIFFAGCRQDINYLSDEKKLLVENTTFYDWYGNEIKVAEFKGKIVIIDFWESWCGPCLSAFPGFQRALNKYPDELVIIAATVGWNEGQNEAMSFKESTDYDFIYVDGRELSAKLGFVGIPFKIVLGRDGKVYDWKTGSNGAASEYDYLIGLISR